MTVHLVGAGPGDPALLTVAAAELLRARAGGRLRPAVDGRRSSRSRRPDAERHCVGPRARPARAARSTRSTRCWSSSAASGDVVRLKSGDPFVASRGGEEARRAAATRGSPCASSPASRRRSPRPPRPASRSCCASSASRPRSSTATTTTSTPSRPTGTRSRALGGTLVILTGRGRIRRIAAALIAGGRAPDTPVAAISAAEPRRAAGAARHARRRSRRRCRRP